MLQPTRIYQPRHFGQSKVDLYRQFSEAGRYDLRIFGSPNSARSAVAARGQIEDEIAVRPGSFLTALSSSSAAAAGFKFQLTVKATGETLFPTLVRDTVGASRPIPRFNNRRLPNYLRSPWAVPGDGLLSVTIVNLASVGNDLCLCLWFAEPFGGSVAERAR